MVKPIFELFIGCFLIYVGIKDIGLLSIALGVILIVFSLDDFYYMKNGKRIFGSPD